MTYYLDDFFEASDIEEQVSIAKQIPPNHLLDAVDGFPWDGYTDVVLGAIADREDCPLLAALLIFARGAPDYYEKTGKLEGAHYGLVKKVHDNVGLGKYKHDPADQLQSPITLSEISSVVTPYIGPRKVVDENLKTKLWEFSPSFVRKEFLTSTKPKPTKSDIEKSQKMRENLREVFAEGNEEKRDAFVSEMKSKFSNWSKNNDE